MTTIGQQLGSLYGEVNVRTSFQHLSHEKQIDQVTSVAKKWNRPDYLIKFINRTSLLSLGLEGERLHFTVTDTPSSETRHVMIVQENNQTINRPDWREGAIIHNQNSVAKTLYWSAVLKTLEHAAEEAVESGDLVVFVENTCSQVTNNKNRVPRSIGLVHGHITRFPRQLQEQDYSPLVKHNFLVQEVAAWKRIEESFLAKLNKHCRKSNVVFAKRKSTLPPGYMANISDDSRVTLKTAQKVSRTLTDHHAAYRSSIGAVSDVFNGQFKPQPSYRTYLEIVDGRVKLSISPILVSHAGSITAAGIFTNRIKDETYPINRRRRKDSEFVKRVGDEMIREFKVANKELKVLRNGYSH